MKQLPFFMLLLAFLFTACNTSQILGSAKNKTNSEIRKKTNKKIEDVFNKKEKEEEQDTPPEEDAEPNKDNGEEPPEEPTLTSSKGDFIPGHKVIFMDSLKRELMGEFPSKWDLVGGSAENARMGNQNVISLTTAFTKIKPLMITKNYLPEQFTVEFDIYFHYTGNEGYTLKSDNGLSIRINNDNFKYGGYSNRATTVKKGKGWRHIAFSFNKRAMKVYMNGERLVNIPNLKAKPNNLIFSALSHGASKGKPALLTNIRIAEGGVPLYNRLITDGRIVTQDIHFDYNKSSIKPASMPIIRDLAAMMKNHSDVQLSVEGHTDGDGADSFNQQLSEQRATAVKQALIDLGVSSSRLRTRGWGEQKPVGSNSSEEGKAQNRRVEFVLL